MIAISRKLWIPRPGHLMTILATPHVLDFVFNILQRIGRSQLTVLSMGDTQTQEESDVLMLSSSASVGLLKFSHHF